jgi:ABC-type branched-subunit amino acid transport system substrate-binding protein
MPGDAAPIVKIGLIAPFEGAGRPLGYAVLASVKAAVAAGNASGQLGPYRVALVALNDDLDPRAAAAQAQALVLDPDVLAVLGPWSADTAAATKPILVAAGVPQIARSAAPVPAAGEKWGDTALANAANLAGNDARSLLDALAADIRAHGRPTRAGVAAKLR